MGVYLDHHLLRVIVMCSQILQVWCPSSYDHLYLRRLPLCCVNALLLGLARFLRWAHSKGCPGCEAFDGVPMLVSLLIFEGFGHLPSPSTVLKTPEAYYYEINKSWMYSKQQSTY